MSEDVRLDEEHLAAYTARVREGLDATRSRIAAAGGDPESIRIVAVTKTFGIDAVIAAVRAGCSEIGENYADELVAKARALSDIGATGTTDSKPAIRWHYLGELQRNKINRLVPHVACFQAVDRLEEGIALAQRAPQASVLVEVNTTGAPGRAGVEPPAVPELVARLRELELSVDGLMTVAPVGGGEDAVKAFRSVATLRAELGLREASMGMSEDLECAVAEGSTMVRVGRALFGPRP